MTVATATSLCQGTEEARGRGILPPKNGNITRFVHDFGEFDYVYKANTNLLDQSLSQNLLSENTASNGFSKYGYDQFNNRSVVKYMERFNRLVR